MALSIHGTTYNTVTQMTSRIAELTYKNRLLGESDERVTELNAIYESLEETNKFEGNIIMNITSSYHLAKVFFDDGEPIPAVVPDLRWNGWAMPLIPFENARENLLKAGFYETFEVTDDGIHYIDGNENPAHAPRVMLAGEKFYNFGELGLCWNQY